MRLVMRLALGLGLASALWLGMPANACSATRTVPPRPGALTAALAAAAAGDTLVLAAGRHAGPVVLDRAVTLRGAVGAMIDGGGRASVLDVTASGTVVEDLEIRGSGRRVLTIDSGVRVLSAAGVTLRRLRLRDVLYGIYAERAADLRVEGSDLAGRVAPLDERGEGNGIHLWYSSNAILTGNTITRFTDAIYLSFADRTRVARNRAHDCGRYGLHTMYCQDNHLIENVFTRNLAGIAIMFSNRLRVERNLMVRNRGPRTYGLLLRDCSAGRFEGNQLVDNTVGIFMDNSNRNQLRGNLLQDNGWGVILFASCAKNEFSGNDFLNDDYPMSLDMRRSDNRLDDGVRGNYWSEAAPYDLDGNGVSDVPYSPVSAFAFVSKQYPDLAVLAKSPAVAALAVAERVFPALQPSEITDHFPLLEPVTGATRTPLEREAEPRSRGALAGFAGLLAAGLAGLAWGRTRA